MKPWYKSKTIWIHIITLLIMIVGAVVDGKAITDPHVLTVLITVQSVLGILSRFVTDTAIEGSK